MIEALRQPQLAFVLIIYFLSIVAFSIMTTVFSLFMMFRLGYDPWHSGWIFAFVGLVSAIIQGGLIGKLARRFGERTLVAAGTASYTLGLVLVPTIWRVPSRAAPAEDGELIAAFVDGSIAVVVSSAVPPLEFQTIQPPPPAPTPTPATAASRASESRGRRCPRRESPRTLV